MISEYRDRYTKYSTPRENVAAREGIISLSATMSYGKLMGRLITELPVVENRRSVIARAGSS